MNILKINLIALIILFTSIACKAQGDIVNYSNIYINIISIATFSPNDFVNTIGNPLPIYIDDMGFEVDVYKKDENSISFYKNSSNGETDRYKVGDLISFDIMTSSISLKVNGTTFKVGDSITVLIEAFPNSYNQGKQNNTIIIGLRGDMNGGTWLSDNSLIIRYDRAQKIKDIHLYYAL